MKSPVSYSHGYFRLSIVCCFLLWLSGCTQQPTTETQWRDAHSRSIMLTPVELPPSQSALTANALSDLIVGELAGIERDYPLALEKYATQAKQTRDPAIVAKATRVAVYTKQYERVAELGSLWTDIEPNNVEAHDLMAQSLARLHRFDEAMTHCKFNLQNKYNETLMAIAVDANRLGTEQRASLLAAMNKLHQQLPKQQSLLLAIALVQRQQKMLPEAIATADQMLALAPLKESAILFKVQTLQQQGRIPEAMALLKQKLQRLPKSKKLNLQYVRLLLREDIPLAHRHLKTLVKAFPNDPELLFMMSMVDLELGNVADAQRGLHQLTQYPPMAASAHFELGAIAEHDGQHGLALQHYQRVTRGPKLLPALARIGNYYRHKGQLDDAQKHFQLWRQRRPDLAPDIYQIESEILMAAEQYQQANTLLNGAIQTMPENNELLYSRSLVREKLKDIAGAEADLRAILAKDNDNAMALNALGYTLTVHTNRFDEAHTLISRALALRPGDPAITDSLGWVLFRLGKYDEATKHLRAAMKKMPDPEVAAHLGEVLWAQGNKKEAQQVWDSILKQKPDATIILDTMKRLKASESTASKPEAPKPQDTKATEPVAQQPSNTDSTGPNNQSNKPHTGGAEKVQQTSTSNQLAPSQP